MKLKAVFLLEPEAHAQVFGPEEMRDLESCVDFVIPYRPVPSTVAELDGGLANVEAIFSGWGAPMLHPGLLARMPALRAVFHSAGSVKSLATDAMWARGVRVTCAARKNAVPVSEFALSQILFCLKHGWQRVAEIRDQRLFRKEDEHMPGAYGSTVGLLSLGHTGRLVAELLKPFDLQVIAYDPVVSASDARELGIELTSLEEVFARSDVVSCHTPLLPQTVRMLRGEHFARMRPGATFLNTARGAVVNEPELIQVLQERPDLFALLDVTDPEPPPADSPLFRLPNVVVTPHIAGSLGRECRRMGRMMVDEVHRYLAGQPLEGEVFPRQLSLLA